MKTPVGPFEGKNIALVHDWLTGMRGGEKVLEVYRELFPKAPIYTLVYNPGSVSRTLASADIRPSFIDRLPFKSNAYRRYLPLMPKAVESFDVSRFDVVLSTSHAVAKGVSHRTDALHVCYCHTPMRYVWDQFDVYFGKGRANVATRLVMSIVAPYLRAWDVRTAARVSHFVANSRNVQDRIRRIYRREAEVLHAPVDTTMFRLSDRDEGYFLVVSALVPYKRVDIAIDACTSLGVRLVIAGKGPELANLERRAGRNTEFVGWQSDERLADLYAGCRALIFPGEEDFGIVPLEAMATGKPVIAYAKGGVMETVVADGPRRTGLFFHEQTPDALEQTLRSFDPSSFTPSRIRERAEEFGRPLFKQRLTDLLRRYEQLWDTRIARISKEVRETNLHES